MMAKKIKVTLIFEKRVKAELKLLDRAEADKKSRDYAKAVAIAKKLVRESIVLKVLPNSRATLPVSNAVYKIYKQHFRDVGENTFVCNDRTMNKFIAEVQKIQQPECGGIEKGMR